MTKEEEKERKLKNTERAMTEPAFLLLVSVISELKCIGILSPDELKNITTHYHQGIDKMKMSKDYDAVALIMPIAMLADEELAKLVIKKMGKE